MMKANSLVRRQEGAWEIAKARFLEDLEPLEQQLYNHATIENIFYSTSNASRRDADTSKTRATLQKLGPLFSAIETYGKAVDTFVSINPLSAAPFWGCIRVLLVAAEAHTKFYANIVDCLARIGDILPRYRDFERIYNAQKHPRLAEALSNTYLDILVLCNQFRRILRDHQASKIRRILKPLVPKQQFEDAIEKFRRHKQNVDDEADACHKIDAAEERETRLVEVAAERRRELLCRLSPIDCAPNHRELQGIRYAGTGSWLLQHHEYLEWETSDQGSVVLSCSGIPGCGKSVLASVVIDSLKSSHSTIFYYCDYADKRTLLPANVFGTLARQVLEKWDSIPDAIAADIRRAGHDGDRLIDPSEPLKILRKCFYLSPVPIAIILDGIDECPEHWQRIIHEGLRQQMQSPRSGSKTKLFITSRGQLDTTLKWKAPIVVTKVAMSKSAISMDIEAYVRGTTKHRISNGSLVVKSPDLEELIVHKLVDGAQGIKVFYHSAPSLQKGHLVSLILESDHAIKEVLENLPRSLSETYDRLLSRIEGLDRATTIERMFKWLVCAREPLRVDELCEGLAFTLEDTMWNPDKVVTDLTRLVRACSNLVTIDTETQIVKLSHYTVEQYLLGCGSANYHFTRQEADIMAGEFCIAFLSFADFDTRVTKYRENTNTDLIALSRLASRRLLVGPDQPGRDAINVWNHFRPSGVDLAQKMLIDMTKYSAKRALELSHYSCLEYVIKHWLYHSASFVALQVYGQDQIKLRASLFQELVFEKVLPFQYQPWVDCIPTERVLRKWAALGWGLMENHPGLIYLALSESAIMPLQCGRLSKFIAEYWTVSCSALVTGGRFRVSDLERPTQMSYRLDQPEVHWLIKKLTFACQMGYAEAIRSCMLENCGEIVQYCILVAATCGHVSVLEAILPFRNAGLSTAKVDYAGYSMNALELALVRRNGDVAARLLDAGMEFELFGNDEEYFRKLDEAIDGSQPEAVESLLAIRFTLCSISVRQHVTSDRRVVSALHRAAQSNQLEIFDVMLRHGVDSCPKDLSYPSTLMYAIISQNEAIVDLILASRMAGDSVLGIEPLSFSTELGRSAAFKLLRKQDPRLPGARQPYDWAADHISATKHVAYVDQGLQLALYPTLLYLACYYGNLHLVKFLLEAGASAHSFSPSRRIYLSAQAGQIVRKCRPYITVGILEGAGTDGDETPLWQTPFDAARSQGHQELLQFLEEDTKKGTTRQNEAPSLPLLSPLLLNHWKRILKVSGGTLAVSNSAIIISRILGPGGEIMNLSDSKAIIEFYVAAGLDLIATTIGYDSLLLCALEHDSLCVRSAISSLTVSGEGCTQLQALHHVLSELSERLGSPPRMCALLLILDKRLASMKLKYVLPGNGKYGSIVLSELLSIWIISVPRVKPFLTEALNYLTRSNELGTGYLSLATLIIWTLRISTMESSSIVLSVDQEDLSILESVCQRTRRLEHHNFQLHLKIFSKAKTRYHNLRLLCAIHSGEDRLARSVCNIEGGGQWNRCHWTPDATGNCSTGHWIPSATSPLMFAVQNRAPRAIVSVLYEQLSFLGFYYNPHDPKATARDAAMDVPYVEAVAILLSWHDTQSKRKRQPWDGQINFTPYKDEFAHGGMPPFFFVSSEETQLEHEGMPPSFVGSEDTQLEKKTANARKRIENFTRCLRSPFPGSNPPRPAYVYPDLCPPFFTLPQHTLTPTSGPSRRIQRVSRSPRNKNKGESHKARDRE